MGKVQKPLRILLHPALQSIMLELSEKGHDVTCGLIEDYDLVLGVNCWRMTPGLTKHLDLAIKGARALRYTGRQSEKPPERSEGTASSGGGALFP